MDVMAQARRNLQLDLRSALASGAFKIHYQPLLNLHTKRISTCEALLRWPHPVRGMVSPAEFIPVAEEMGLIVEIGNFVLREACLECAKWPDDVRVAVNMSPIQFRRGNVADGHPRGAGGRRAAGQPARDRDHRVGLPQRHRAHAPLARRAAGDGRAHLARRFRHRLLEPELPAQLSAEQGQDRPLVPAGGGHQPTVAQPAAQRRAPERRSRHVGGGGGDRDGGAVRPGRARDQRRRGAGLPDRLPHARQRHPRHAVRPRPVSPRSRDPHSQRGEFSRPPLLLAPGSYALLAVQPASCARARRSPSCHDPCRCIQPDPIGSIVCRERGSHCR